MTSEGLDLSRVALTADDREYIAGAVLERQAAAAARGEHYGWADFVREALIEAAHR